MPIEPSFFSASLRDLNIFHMVFVQGGCCKICGGVTHLAKDCPNKGCNNGSVAAMSGGNTCKFL